MTPISVNDELPPDKTYVLAHYNGGNWIDSEDQEGVEWVVAQFRRGLSADEREAMEDCEAKRTYSSEDEWANNKRPYCWHMSMMNLFGQDVDYWMSLPRKAK